VKSMRKAWINIPGIGHKVKSKFNPDKRCEVLLELSQNFPSRKHLDFALAVEEITVEKRCNLILNVDWMVAVMLLDLFEDIWLSFEERVDYIDAGIFNAFFILARTTGFIGHIIDQKRLKEPLYRTPWDDILYE
jgi:ATP-citrate lyase alpha-subunit